MIKHHCETTRDIPASLGIWKKKKHETTEWKLNERKIIRFIRIGFHGLPDGDFFNRFFFFFCAKRLSGSTVVADVPPPVRYLRGVLKSLTLNGTRSSKIKNLLARPMSISSDELRATLKFQNRYIFFRFFSSPFFPPPPFFPPARLL